MIRNRFVQGVEGVTDLKLIPTPQQAKEPLARNTRTRRKIRK